MLRHLLLVAMTLGPLPALANQTTITDRATFVDRIANRNLSRLGVGVTVTPGGRIEGSAFGTAVTGTWEWRGRQFCREMQWGDRTWDDSCQSVHVRDGRVYFQPSSGSSVYLNLP
ncbi:dihydrodipicolinate reductase [Maribius pontilimi]|uniref:Dihydrodipicolinate reductase n=1 Tax=Palleronia pontilimi TaxID=1964209 RepID=A0A934ME38_9RHOB|nr:dihydrodipicolinate reductase [Palleronia pontilimi]MBJ3764130.1 dihydrodipicolinate reductase [Palleronia pontilimi]